MCLSNLTNQSEYLNEIANMDQQDDKPTFEGVAVLDAALEADPIRNAVSRELAELSLDLNKERELLKCALHLMRRCRDEGMPFHLRREIDDVLAAGKDYL